MNEEKEALFIMRTSEMERKNPGILDLALDRERREAFLKYRKRSGRDSEDEIREMEAYILSEACETDLKRLKAGEFFFSAPFHYRVAKNFSGRKRDVYAWKGTEKYLFSLLAYTLQDWDSVFCDCLYSFRKGVSGRDFLLKLRNLPHASDYYVMKADVSNYVGSIVPEKILTQLEVLWKDDPEFLALLKFILFRRECIERDGSVVPCEPGGLGGNPLGNYFMNVYLMDLDEYYKSRAVLYCRYSDDLVVFARTKEEAESFLSHFHQILEEKSLSTNPEKTRLIEPGGEVEILGCRLVDGKMDISLHSKAKIKRKLLIYAKWLIRQKRERGYTDEQAAQRMIEYCKLVFFGKTGTKWLSWTRWLFPVITETSSLSELDHFIQNLVRFVYWSSFAKKRYRTTYADLKRMGYQSLLHAYYHFTYKKVLAVKEADQAE